MGKRGHGLVSGQRPVANKLDSPYAFVKTVALYDYPSFQLYSHLGNWVIIGLLIYFIFREIMCQPKLRNGIK